MLHLRSLIIVHKCWMQKFSPHKRNIRPGTQESEWTLILIGWECSLWGACLWHSCEAWLRMPLHSVTKMGSAHGKLRKLQFKHFTVSPITVMPWVQHIFPESCHEATWSDWLANDDHIWGSCRPISKKIGTYKVQFAMICCYQYISDAKSMTCSKNWNNGESELRDFHWESPVLGGAMISLVDGSCKPHADLGTELGRPHNKKQRDSNFPTSTKSIKKSLQGLGHAVWWQHKCPKMTRKRPKGRDFPCCWHCLGWSKPKSKKYRLGMSCNSSNQSLFLSVQQYCELPAELLAQPATNRTCGTHQQGFQNGWSHLGGHWRSGEEQGNRANHILWLSHSQKDAIYLTWQRCQKWLKNLAVTSD